MTIVMTSGISTIYLMPDLQCISCPKLILRNDLFLLLLIRYLIFFFLQISVEWIGCLEKRQTKVGQFVDVDTKDITNRYEEIIAEDKKQYTLEYKTHLQIGVQVILIFFKFLNFFIFTCRDRERVIN